MRQSILIATSLLLALAPAALAADNAPVLGKWASTTETPQGTFEVVYEFTEADGELKGTWTNTRRNGDLTNVSWDGKTLKFGREASMGGQTFNLKFEAAVDGDTMTGKMIGPRREREFTANRSE